MPGDAPKILKPTDPKAILRHLKPDADDRLPLAKAALAAGLLDPVNVKAADHLDEAMSHLDAVAADARTLLEEGEEDVGNRQLL